MNRDEKIEKVRALYERAATSGEKAAAKAALDRLGASVDREPEQLQQQVWEMPYSSVEEIIESFDRLREAMRETSVSAAEFEKVFLSFWSGYNDKTQDNNR